MKKLLTIGLLFTSLLVLSACNKTKTVDEILTENRTVLSWKQLGPMVKFAKQIKEYEAILATSGCKAGESYYLSLSQNYSYLKDFKKGLSYLDELEKCYPTAYSVATDKRKLLLNNKAVIYSDWWYYLLEEGKVFSNKYKESKDLYLEIIGTFGWTNLLDEDERQGYMDRISDIEKQLDL